MKLTLFLLSCTLGCLAQMPDDLTYSDCGSSNDAGTTVSMAVTPDHVGEGTLVTITGTYSFANTILPGAYIIVTKTKESITDSSERIDLCTSTTIEDGTSGCPLDPGQYTITYTKQMPSTISQGDHDIHVEAFDTENRRLFCSDFTFDLTD